MTHASDIYDALDRAAAEIAEVIGQSSGQSQNPLATDRPLKNKEIGQSDQCGQSERRSIALDRESEIDRSASPNSEAEGRARKSLYRLVKLATLAKGVENKRENRGQSSGQSALKGARLAKSIENKGRD